MCGAIELLQYDDNNGVWKVNNKNRGIMMCKNIQKCYGCGFILILGAWFSLITHKILYHAIYNLHVKKN